MSDERPPANAVPFSFTGKLTEAQRVALNALLEHEDGVLVAPPGSGKTVIACAAIAARAVSTLILVHRRPLLEQWRAQLQAFLGLEKSAIHILQSSRHTGAPLALGMLQAVARADSAAALFADYSHLIIDECHHVPAASFEATLKECPARFTLGLTATPVRKDGLQKILYLQCGPIRHRIEMDHDDAVARTLIVRQLVLGLPEQRAPIHLVWQGLVNSPERNRSIVADVASAIGEKRFCAVLSDRKDHLQCLQSLTRERLGDVGDALFRIDGSVGKKQRRALFQELHRLAGEGKPFVLFATSSFLGGGFDLPELNTLVLAMPISFTGRLIQYAGRLHRRSSGKTDVRIYDYVETDNPLTVSMHRKRLATYRQLGYQLCGPPGNDQDLFSEGGTSSDARDRT
ncbi:MAG: DEAD/DEAH box helicase family protein [Verrucomicrobia bacterium]|nr:DEAD/DEAH box helicase family protein [Verrucomicrobiota bacterium]